VIPGENVHGLLMYGKENRSKEKKDKEQLLITQMTKFL
jgi:hypothetical protein